MNIPYSVTTEISNALKLPKEIYWHAFNVLTQGNGLLFALNCFRERKLNIPLAYFVLNHLVCRTLQFDKILEFVPYKDIIEGRPDIALPGCTVGLRTIEAIMAELSPKKGDFLLKLYVTQNGHVCKTPMRGFNLPGLFQLVEAWVYGNIDKRDADRGANIKPSILMLKNLYLLENINDLLSHYEKAFNFLLKYKNPIVVENIDSFLKQWQKHLPTGRDYQHAKEDVIDAKKHLKENKLRKWYSEKINIDGAVKP